MTIFAVECFPGVGRSGLFQDVELFISVHDRSLIQQTPFPPLRCQQYYSQHIFHLLEHLTICLQTQEATARCLTLSDLGLGPKPLLCVYFHAGIRSAF